MQEQTHWQMQLIEGRQTCLWQTHFTKLGYVPIIKGFDN